jgi:putative ABC transport system permease protein
MPGRYQFINVGSDSTQSITAQLLQTDENYIEVYQIPLVSGSFFDGNRLDSGKVILNESAVHALGIEDMQAAIGQQIRVPGDPTVFTVKVLPMIFILDPCKRK